MVLSNYIALEPGVPLRLHFTDWYNVEREIQEKESGRIKKVKGLVFLVDRVGALETARTFSVLSQKLAAHLEPFLEKDRFRDYEFIITKMGDGFYTDFSVEPIKISQTV